MVTIGYLGPKGTFTELSAEKLSEQFRDNHLVPLPSVFDVLKQIKNEEVEFGVVPIEHALLGKGEVILSGITDIYSHPQALEQCQQFIRQHCPKAKKHMMESTAVAAQNVSQISGDHAAAIGRVDLGKLFGLEVIQKSIQDSRQNYTRFIMVSRTDHPPTGKDKTSMVFSLEKDRPGGLASILQQFAEKDINLTKIESRPRKTDMGDYYFFIDCVGHREDHSVSEVLRNLQNKVIALRILGSYPRAGK